MGATSAGSGETDAGDGEGLRQGTAGDRAVLKSVLAEYHRGLLAYALSITGASAGVEDIVQEAFLRLFARWGGKPVESIRAYLYAVTRNLAMDEARRASLQSRKWTEVARAAVRRQSGLDSEDAELQRLALAELDELPAEQRETVVLKIYGKMTFGEIATLTGVPLSTCASRYRYALEELARRLSAGKESP
jgi:RNA polymerase sigma-70 factor (ECF subfamily)